MSAILNISLDDAVGQGPVAQRHRTIMACMRLCFLDAVGEIKSVTYTDPDGKQVHEDCSVVTVGFHGSRAAFEDALFYLSQQLGQDCIAVLYDTGEGLCVGPGADRWPFDLAKFNLPLICSLRKEAA